MQLRHTFWTVQRNGASRSPPGKFGDVDLALALLACVSVSPAHAISGSVNTTAGIACGSNATLCPAMASTAVRPSCDGLVGQHGFANHITDRINGRVGSLPLLVDFDKSALIDFDLVFCRVREFPSSACVPTETNTRSKTCSFSLTSAPSNVTRIPVFIFFQRRHCRVQQNRIEEFLQSLMQGKNEIAISSREKPGSHLDARSLSCRASHRPNPARGRCSRHQ